MKGANKLENYNNIQDLLQLDEADPDLENEDAAPEQEAAVIENEIAEAQIAQTLRLDYKLKTCQERADLVNRIVEQTPKEQLTNRYLEILGDYIMGGLSKEEKKEHTYLTDNRRITIDRRETSFEGLAEKFENGEDGIYQLITNDKNIIFQHKQEITKEDIETIPGLKELRAAIEQIEAAGKVATGRKKYLLKKQLIEMRKDQYILKNSAKPQIYLASSARGINKIDLSEIHIDLLRHGEDEQDKLGGWSDNHLTTTGIMQITDASDYLDKDYDLIISSDLVRTRETADIVSTKLSKSIIFDEKFREINNGKLKNLTKEEFNLSYPGLYYNTLSMDQAYPNGESPTDFYIRIKDAFIELLYKYKGKKILIITHGGVITVLQCLINGWKYSNLLKITVPHAALVKLNRQ